MTCLYINVKFSKLSKSTTFFNEAQNKFWAHHGFSKKGAPYAFKNVEMAFDRGIRGVELDLFYDETLCSFLVVHDMNEQDTLILDQLLSGLTTKGQFWFDLKNLKKGNSSQIIESLIKIEHKHELRNKFVVESKNASELNVLSQLGFFTCLWISTSQNENLIVEFYRNLKNKINLLNNTYSAISMPYYYYQREGKTLYGNFPIHCWVSPEEYEREKEVIIADDKLKIVLFDRP